MAQTFEGSIHPTAIIGDEVVLGPGVSVGPFAVILGPTRIGAGSNIGAGALLGGPPEFSTLPQHLGWRGEGGYRGLRIGEAVVIRERAVIHQGSLRETVVGDRTWILNSAYLAHDVEVGSDATISAGVSIGGHASVGDRANIGMNATIHQRRVVGAGAMIGMATPLTRDAPPFSKVYGTPPRIHGVNRIAIERAGLPDPVADRMADAYRTSADFSEELMNGPDSEYLRPYFGWWSARSQRPLSSMLTDATAHELA
jgi:UDP-N-acetylglucosamine acyltransferase